MSKKHLYSFPQSFLDFPARAASWNMDDLASDVPLAGALKYKRYLAVITWRRLCPYQTSSQNLTGRILGRGLPSCRISWRICVPHLKTKKKLSQSQSIHQPKLIMISEQVKVPTKSSPSPGFLPIGRPNDVFPFFEKKEVKNFPYK